MPEPGFPKTVKYENKNKSILGNFLAKHLNPKRRVRFSKKVDPLFFKIRAARA